MKTKVISALAIFILSISAINCDRNVNPFVPEVSTGEQAGVATLVGNIVRVGSTSEDVRLVNIGIRGTNLRANPDREGNFRIDNVPLGDILLEIDVKNSLSYIPINDIESNDEIDVKMEVLSNDKAVLKDKGKKNQSKKRLYVTIKPYKWNINWEESSDEVTVRIYGKGLDDIKEDSVQMEGPEGDTIEPLSYDSSGNSLLVNFLQKEAITIIPDPKLGESYEIKVTGELKEDTLFELIETIVIVGKKSEGELIIEIEPHKWNTAWENNEGVVTARITGEGFDEIDPDTVMMVGPEGDEIPFQSYEVTGNYFMAKFLKKDALSIIPDPISGDIHEIQVVGVLNDEKFELTEVIILVGKKSEGELSLVITPGKWNTNWEESSDEVTARISGEGFDEIDPSSVKMKGPEGDEIKPESSEVGGNSFMAKFLQNKAIGIIPDPKAGESYEIHVIGTLDSEPFDLSYEIEIVGKKMKELSLKIQPDKWNTNWNESDDEVEARITGEGFDEIDPGTVTMAGPDGNPMISPYSYEAGEDSFIARFYRKEAIGLISDPKPKDSYEIQVSGKFNDGMPFELFDEIGIAGKEVKELSLKIQPDKWNTNWKESDDGVEARITGEGFDEIDPGTVEMAGPDGNPMISPYTYEAGEDSFIARFYRKEAIGLISDPKPKDSYKIQVTGKFNDGIDFILKYTISIVGSKK